MKNKFYFLFLLMGLLATVGCKKYLNVNSDTATPQNPSNSAVFPAMLAGLPRGLQYDSRYLGKYIQNWLATASGDTYDRHGYVAGSDNTGDVWRQCYYGLGKNLDYIIENGKKNGQYDYVGACYALKAYLFQITTDYHGEIIFTEAFKDNTYYFKYDTQDVVYKGIDSLCRIALQYLDKGVEKNNSYLGVSDYVYKGDMTKWRKFVYGILALNYGHLTNKASFQPDSVIKFVDNAMASVNDDFVVPFDATRNDDANFFGTYRDNLTSFRQSKFIVKLLDGTTFTGLVNKDPRISHMLNMSADTSGTGNGGYKGVDAGVGDPFNGVTTGANARKRVPNPWADSAYANPSASVFTTTGKYLFQNKAGMPVMTYEQMQFIKAEAAFRKGDKATAYAAYLNGINAHFDFINRSYNSVRSAANIYYGSPISAAARTTYLASANVKQTAAGLTLTDIMLQKYIAQWGWGWEEQWVDLRRYHYTDLDPLTGQQVFKNFVLPNPFFPDNAGKPAYRVRPRFNSEYVWNLDQLKLYGGDKADYHTYETWVTKP